MLRSGDDGELDRQRQEDEQRRQLEARLEALERDVEGERRTLGETQVTVERETQIFRKRGQSWPTDTTLQESERAALEEEMARRNRLNLSDLHAQQEQEAVEQDLSARAEAEALRAAIGRATEGIRVVEEIMAEPPFFGAGLPAYGEGAATALAELGAKAEAAERGHADACKMMEETHAAAREVYGVQLSEQVEKARDQLESKQAAMRRAKVWEPSQRMYALRPILEAHRYLHFALSCGSALDIHRARCSSKSSVMQTACDNNSQYSTPGARQ
jgi:hypothetical protein